jgi:hypothetical protein
MAPWLKAGLIGGAVLVALNLLGLIPCVGLVTCFLSLLAYVGIGALAAYWAPRPRDPGQGAGQGALAALVGALIGGVVNVILFTIQMAVMDTAAILAQLPQESLRQLEQSGLDPAMLTGPGAGAFYGSICCLGGLVFAAILGAIGGAIYAGLRQE